MGRMVGGTWYERGEDIPRTEGRFDRQPTTFHGRLSADGATGWKAEPGRYVLVVSYACPWAHRTLVVRALKRLEDVVDVCVVEAEWGPEGWAFSADLGAAPDPLAGAQNLHELYTHCEPDFSGRITVPVLWDRREGRIVNNESSEIIRDLDTAFDAFTDVRLDLYPEALRSEIDTINERIYDTVNNGVYKAGFAGSQAAYEEAVGALFETLDALETRLAGQRYLCGDRPTEADWRLLPTLLRFDEVYATHFKCNVRRIADHPNLWAYTRDLYQVPGVAGTLRMDHIKRHYYRCHTSLNPRRIVPVGPAPDFAAPHDRGRFA